MEFKNEKDNILRGILHQGALVCYKNISLIFLNTGLNDMVGWHRIQVKLARFFSEKGYNVLRYDDSGIGDSDGEILKESIVEIFSEIERGLFVENATAAFDFISSKFKNDKILYIGFCGGGLTAVHSAALNHKISGIVDIGGPVTLSSKEYLQKIDPWEVKRNIDKYRTKFFNFGSWIRFMTGKGEYAVVFRSLIHFSKHKIKGQYKELQSHDPSLQNPKDVNINFKFYESFQKYLDSRRPILFYYAELDSATWEFKKYFLNKYRDLKLWNDRLLKYIEVEKANHIFSDSDSQEQMKNDISKWLEQFN